MFLFRAEMRALLALSTPVVITQLANMAMGFVDTLMVSRIDVESLAASSLANNWGWGWMSLGMGVVLGMDPMVSQAHGRGDPRGVALALQRGLVVGVLVSVPLALAYAWTGTGLLWLGQEPGVSAAAEQYMVVRIPSIPFWMAYTVLRQYLQGRTLVRPAMWCMLIANLANVVLNWALIFGHLGAPRLGLLGAGIASSITTMLMPLLLWAWIELADLRREAWRPWSRSVLRLRGLRQVVRLGFPVGVQMTLEAWGFSLAAMMAGWVGVQALAAHQIVLTMVALFFMIPLGLSTGAATRVGNLIGAGDHPGAQRACAVAIVTGASVMVVGAAVFVVFRYQIPLLFTADAAVVALGAAILPVAAAFQIVDGTQIVSGGLLRGMGRPNAAAVANLGAYFVFALPLAWWLAFEPGLGLGLVGIWWGLAAGPALVAVALVTWVRRTSLRPLHELHVRVT